MAEPESIREEIIHAALELAASEGVRGASVRRIAARVGIRSASVYSYFPEGKEELLSVAMVLLSERFRDRIVAQVRDDESAAENLRRMVIAHVQWMLANPSTAPAWNSIMAADAITPALSDDRRVQILAMIDESRSLLQHQLERLGASASDAQRWMRMIIGICDDANFWGPADSGAVPPEEFAWMSIARILGIDSRVLSVRQPRSANG